MAKPPEEYDSSPWGELWRSLCHQGDVYTASYAAVPHLVRIASIRPVKERVHHIGLIGHYPDLSYNIGDIKMPAEKKDSSTSLSPRYLVRQILSDDVKATPTILKTPLFG